MSTLLASKVTLRRFTVNLHCWKVDLSQGTGNRELVLEQIGQSVLLGKKMFLATSQTYLKTIGDIPAHTPPQVNTRTNGGVVCVCEAEGEKVHTQPLSAYLFFCFYKFFLGRASFCSYLSTFRRSLSSLSYLRECM